MRRARGTYRSGAGAGLGGWCLFLFLLPQALPLSAQVRVQVYDARTEGPVPYAHVSSTVIATGAQAMTVSDPLGRAVVPADEASLRDGLVLRISFVGYTTITDTVWNAGERRFALVPSTQDLPTLVVTGQYTPIAPERAVHQVRVLDTKLFQRMAANNLGDALRNELNIRLRQDPFLGASISMQGLGGENVKLLVDGVPVIGRMDGNIDLAQLDLTGIERVEIIEGPLSVSYGTNALAGTINLITSKGANSAATLRTVAYAEHIGRLNTTVNATRGIGRHSMVVNAGRTFFAGWDPARPGLPDLGPSLADSTRFQAWKPREQYFGRFNYRWRARRWTLGYKGEFLHDVILSRGRPRAPFFESAFDERYTTVRMDHALFAEGRIGERGRFNALAAHNRFVRLRNTWFRDLTSLQGELVDAEGMQDTSRFTLTNVRTVYSGSTADRRLRYELGTDINHETGTGGRLDGDAQEITDAALFSSMEYDLAEHLTLRPGLRVAYNSAFAAPLVPSVNVRWKPGARSTLRASYARGFRAPSLKELHLYFVDVNHDITGNPGLRAERSHNLSGSFAYRHARDKSVYSAEAAAFANAVEDLITLAQLDGASFTYVNVGRFRTVGGTSGASWDNGHWLVSTGGGVMWRNDGLALQQGRPWLFSPELRASLTRNWMRSGWSLSLFWKYQGEQANYVFLSETEVVRGAIAPFHLADATLARRLWNERLLVTAGCKDLFDTRDANAVLAGGVHTGTGTTLPMTTGRTWFLRLELGLHTREG